MNKYIAVLLLTISTLPFGTSALADFQKGLDAYDREDYATALKEWEILAEEGDPSSQYNLGVMYRMGNGVAKDDKEAVKWYRLAAYQGDAGSQFLLGYMYLNGIGVPQNNLRAHMWVNLAASQGVEVAENERDNLAKEMTSEDIGLAQQMARKCVAKNYKGC
jgi:TPR repeat protein